MNDLSTDNPSQEKIPLSEAIGTGGAAAPGNFFFKKFTYYNGNKEDACFEYFDEAGKSFFVRLLPANHKEAYMVIGQFGLGYILPQGTDPENVSWKRRADALLQWLAGRLGDMQFHELKELLSDEIVPVPYEAEEDSGPPVTETDRFFTLWGMEEQRLNFFYNYAEWRRLVGPAIYRDQGFHPICNESAYVVHGDVDCPRNSHFYLPGLLQFFHHPWMDMKTPPAKPAQPVPAAYATDFNEVDIITGGENKLERILEHLGEDPRVKAVFLSVACLPVVTGEDVRAAVHNFMKKTGKPVVFRSGAEPDPADLLAGLLSLMKEFPDGTGGLPGTVNLVGFPHGRGRTELMQQLGETGIAVNACFLPDLRVTDVENYKRAQLQVFFPGRVYSKIIQKNLASQPLGSVRPEAPFGLHRTWAFLREVASMAGTEDQFHAFWRKNHDAFSLKWESLTEASRELRLGFILKDSHVRFLIDGTLTLCIPVLRVVEEMGFSLSFLVRTTQDADAHKEILDLMNSLAEPRRHSARTFATYEELEELLRADPAQSFYSDIFYDRRLTRAGKSIFTTNCFEMGFDGAFRAMERLHNICRLPFYRRYSEFLDTKPGRSNA